MLMLVTREMEIHLQSHGIGQSVQLEAIKSPFLHDHIHDPPDVALIIDHIPIDVDILGFGEGTLWMDARMDDVVSGAVDSEDRDRHDQSVAGRRVRILLKTQSVLDQGYGARFVHQSQHRRVRHDLLSLMRA